MTKTELLEKIRNSRQELIRVFDAIPVERRDEPGVEGDWSAKDILVHLTYWEGQLVTLLFQLRSGASPSTMQFSGRTVDEINAAWYAQGRSRAWEAAWSDFVGLGKQVPRRVAQFSDEELNDPKLHARLRGRPLAQWIGSDSYEHEEEHRADIEKWLKKTNVSRIIKG